MIRINKNNNTYDNNNSTTIIIQEQQKYFTSRVSIKFFEIHHSLYPDSTNLTAILYICNQFEVKQVKNTDILRHISFEKLIYL